MNWCVAKYISDISLLVTCDRFIKIDFKLIGSFHIILKLIGSFQIKLNLIGLFHFSNKTRNRL